MPRYVALINWTDQGIRNASETTARAEAFRALLQGLGGELIDLYWTLGSYDIVAVMDAPDDETATAALLKVGALGNIRSTTLRAFSSADMTRILAKAG